LVIALVPFFEVAAPFGWFIGAPLAALIYYLISKDKIQVVPDAETIAAAGAAMDEAKAR
jgi:cytosine/uracil/thiamine/allantoin permease